MSVVRARIERAIASRWFTVAVFLLALLLASSTVALGEFGDEADNLVLGNLLRQGHRLYGELFSHHFPGAYYWVACVQALVGTSIVATRVALACWQIGLLALTARLTRRSTALALLALAWSLLRVFSRGQMVLYRSLSGVSVVVAGALAWDLLDAEAPPAAGCCELLLGLCGAWACSPTRWSSIRWASRSSCWPSGTGAAPPSPRGLGWDRRRLCSALTASGGWADFYRDALLFNAHIYSRYTPTDPQRLTATVKAAATGLGICDGQWWRLSWRPEDGLGTGAFDRWVATGLLYRFAVLAATVSLASRRRWHEAALVYLLAAATLATEDPNFRRQGFTLFALLCALELVLDQRGDAASTRRHQWLLGAMRLGIAAGLTWACVYSAGSSPTAELSYDHTFGQQIRQAEMISAQVCDQADVKLAAYPDGRYLCLLTGLEPLGAILRVALGGRCRHARSANAARRTRHTGHRGSSTRWCGSSDTRVYLAPLLELIEARYTSIGWHVPLSRRPAPVRTAGKKSPASETDNGVRRPGLTLFAVGHLGHQVGQHPQRPHLHAREHQHHRRRRKVPVVAHDICDRLAKPDSMQQQADGQKDTQGVKVGDRADHQSEIVVGIANGVKRRAADPWVVVDRDPPHAIAAAQKGDRDGAHPRVAVGQDVVKAWHQRPADAA